MKVRATYEDGVLKPQTPLPLPEHAEVEVEVDETATWRRAGEPRPLSAAGLALLRGCINLGGDAVADKKAYYDDP